MDDSTPESPRGSSHGRLRWAGLTVVLVLMAIVSIGIGVRHSEARRLVKWTHAQAVPTVEVTRVESAKGGSTLQLPARIDAYSRAPIYARVSGYVKSWSADIGTHVKTGQLLAVIEIPDLDEQLAQAKADLASARANAALAAKTAHRWEALVGSGLVSRQETDQKLSALAAQNAGVKAAAANVGRIEAMKRYARIVAPFNGIVTARNTDVGQLVNAGDNGPGNELFVVSDVRRLRVYVEVPQSDAPAIVPGATARLSVPGYPGHEFKATVVASAGAVSASSGSTLVQLIMENPGGRVLPGSFAIAHFQLSANRDALRVPADALIFDRHGLRVATVGRDDRVAFRHVSIAHDYGDSVQIGSGLVAGDRVIDSPPDGLFDGDRVRIAAHRKRHEPYPGRGAPVARASAKPGREESAGDYGVRRQEPHRQPRPGRI
ncbi:MAG: efflux RND transporter periplasmic adaptor subunit [Proteobacteria bacterium]|nr:efflux RND transporter periplasmic adaptor subunit [Pseudomonadota bacterium]